MSTAPRIAIVHIGKTGGTWLKNALQPFYAPSDICPLQFELQYDSDLSKYSHYRLFDSHFGFDVASKLDARLVTVLRNPIDRIVSLYHYWRELPQTEMGPGYAKKVTFSEFIEPPHPQFVEIDTQNSQTWQIAFGTTVRSRKDHANISPDELLAIAIQNLEKFDVVGVTEAIPALAKRIEQCFGLSLDPNLGRLNATRSRPKLAEIGMDVRDKTYALANVDIALYQHVVENYVLRP